MSNEMIVEYRGVPLTVAYEYEPSGIGGDWDDLLRASISIDAVLVGCVDVGSLLWEQLDEIAKLTIAAHEQSNDDDKTELAIAEYEDRKEYLYG